MVEAHMEKRSSVTESDTTEFYLECAQHRRRPTKHTRARAYDPFYIVARETARQRQRKRAACEWMGQYSKQWRTNLLFYFSSFISFCYFYFNFSFFLFNGRFGSVCVYKINKQSSRAHNTSQRNSIEEMNWMWRASRIESEKNCLASEVEMKINHFIDEKRASQQHQRKIQTILVGIVLDDDYDVN